MYRMASDDEKPSTSPSRVIVLQGSQNSYVQRSNQSEEQKARAIGALLMKCHSEQRLHRTQGGASERRLSNTRRETLRSWRFNATLSHRPGVFRESDMLGGFPKHNFVPFHRSNA